MPRYSVHAKSAKPEAIRNDADKIRFVKEGFAWWGFFFPLPWLLIKGMWEILILAIVLLIAMGSASVALYLPEAAVMVLSFGINLLIGFIGNDLYRWTLQRRGFIDLGPASGESRDEAELRFFLALPPAPLAPAPIAVPVASPQPRDALGLFEAAGSAR